MRNLLNLCAVSFHELSFPLRTVDRLHLFRSRTIAATAEERARLATLLREVLASARKARSFHCQVSELLAAYGVVVDAATELTLRIEDKLVAGGEGAATTAASKA